MRRTKTNEGYSKGQVKHDGPCGRILMSLDFLGQFIAMTVRKEKMSHKEAKSWALLFDTLREGLEAKHGETLMKEEKK